MHSLSQIAASLRQQADELDAIARRHNAADQRHAITAISLAHALCDQGCSDREALDAAASSTGTDRAALAFAWNLEGHRQKAEARRWLRVRFADLEAAGLKDAEIARILSIHPKSVPRLRRELRNQKPDTNR